MPGLPGLGRSRRKGLWGAVLLCLWAWPLVAGAQVTCVAPTTRLTSVALRWDAPVLSPMSTVIAFVIERQVDTGAWEPLARPAGSVLTFLDRNLLPGHTYTYRLSAEQRLPDGTLTMSAYAPPRLDGAVPPCITIGEAVAPGHLVAQPTCGPACVVVSWESADPTQAVHLERRTAVEGATYVVLDEVLGTSLADTGCGGHQTCCYRARYVEGITWSSESCTTTAPSVEVP